MHTHIHIYVYIILYIHIYSMSYKCYIWNMLSIWIYVNNRCNIYYSVIIQDTIYTYINICAVNDTVYIYIYI